MCVSNYVSQPKVCPTCGTCPTCGSKTMPLGWQGYQYYPNTGTINTPNISWTINGGGLQDQATS